jgi:hypothetical protein
MADQLRVHFEKAEQRRKEPWRNDMDAYLTKKAGFAAVTDEAAQTLCATLAEMKAFTPDEAMNLSYTIYGNEASRKFRALCIMQTRGQQRITMHNWYVAEAAGETFLAFHGDRIQHLQWPLFPVGHAAFEALNLELLMETASPSGGGGRPSVYRQNEVYRAPVISATPSFASAAPSFVSGPASSDPSGGEFLHVVANAQGQQAVDSSPLEAIIKREMNSIRTELRRQFNQGNQGQSGGRDYDYNGGYNGGNRGGNQRHGGSNHSQRGRGGPRGGGFDFEPTFSPPPNAQSAPPPSHNNQGGTSVFR